MDIYEESLALHKKFRGKITLASKVSVNTLHDLAVVYTPGVAAPIKEIASNPDAVYDYTWKYNTIAVISDGTRILGLGNVGEDAALPLLEGKSVLFKIFGKVDAIPISLKVKTAEEIVNTIIAISPNFSGINLEDIAKPKIFTVEKELQEKLDIPIFHDDQHGTAIVVLAGIKNSLKLLGKKIQNTKILILGAGAAGIAVAKYLIEAGSKNLIVCDRKGVINRNRTDLDSSKKEVSEITNPENLEGSFEQAIKDSDIFIGLSTIPNILKGQHIKSMNTDPIIFALTNPVPEIVPDEAKKAGAKIIATGRSDYPNQINNALVFPGIFRGALDVRSKSINMPMKFAAAEALANLIPEDKLDYENIIPSMTNKMVVPSIAVAAAREAMNSGVAKIKRNLKEIELNARI